MESGGTANNPHYTDYTRRIVEEMARHYAQHPNIIGWQIDNEICMDDRGCYCPECVAEFRRFLAEKYHTIEELNRRMGLQLWSMEYHSFDQIPPPAPRTWAHPAMVSEWFRFQSRSHANFVSAQAKWLRGCGVQVPIGTDMMPVLEQDYRSTNEHLDVIQFNHYTDAESLYSLAFWNDYLRGLKTVPFWNTETSTCWMGSTKPSGVKPEGFCRVNTWMSYAMGGELCMYWLWRSHWAGQELMHGSVISSAGRPLHMFEEVKRIGAELERVRDVLVETKVDSSGIGLHLSHSANACFRGQPISKQMEGWGTYPRKVRDLFYQPLLERQLRPDVLDPSAKLEDYRVLITPLLPCIQEGELAECILPWVEQGGVWFVGPLTDIRNQDDAKFKHAPLGMLEEVTGARLEYQVPAYPQEYSVLIDGKEVRCQIQCDGYTCGENTQVLATYVQSPVKGLAAITKTPYGKGFIVLVGTALDGAAFAQLVVEMSSQINILPVADASSHVLTVPRKGADGRKVLFCIEYTGKSGRIKLERPMKERLSGQLLRDEIILEPFDVLCLEESEIEE